MHTKVQCGRTGTFTLAGNEAKNTHTVTLTLFTWYLKERKTHTATDQEKTWLLLLLESVFLFLFLLFLSQLQIHLIFLSLFFCILVAVTVTVAVIHCRCLFSSFLTLTFLHRSNGDDDRTATAKEHFTARQIVCHWSNADAVDAFLLSSVISRSLRFFFVQSFSVLGCCCCCFLADRLSLPLNTSLPLDRWMVLVSAKCVLLSAVRCSEEWERERERERKWMNEKESCIKSRLSRGNEKYVKPKTEWRSVGTWCFSPLLSSYFFLVNDTDSGTNTHRWEMPFACCCCCTIIYSPIYLSPPSIHLGTLCCKVLFFTSQVLHGWNCRWDTHTHTHTHFSQTREYFVLHSHYFFSSTVVLLRLLLKEPIAETAHTETYQTTAFHSILSGNNGGGGSSGSRNCCKCSERMNKGGRKQPRWL